MFCALDFRQASYFRSAGWCRLVFASEVVAMVCELGAASCILLEILSLRASGVQQGIEESARKPEISLSLVSVIATLVCLVIMLIGGAAALRAMQLLWTSVQTTAGTTKVPKSSISGVQRCNQVAPGQDCGDENPWDHESLEESSIRESMKDAETLDN